MPTETKEKVATQGCDFADGAKLISVIDHPAFAEVKEGAEVFVSGFSKVYGPYKLDREVGSGNGKKIYLAYSVSNGSAARSKPLTKAELEAENIAKDAKLEAARKALRDAGVEPTF